MLKKVLIGSAAFVALLIVVVAIWGEPAETEDTTAAAPTAEPTATPAPTLAPTATPEPPLLPTATPEPEPSPTTPPEWVEVTVLSGSNMKRSEVFSLAGSPARLHYTVKGDEFAAISIYVLEEGRSLTQDGGFPEVMMAEAGTDETRLVYPKGNYYLDIHAANAEWEVIIEEQR